MTIDDFKSQLDECASVNGCTEMKIHANTGDYEVSSLEYDSENNILKVCTMEDIRQKMYRISYRITKDHRLFAFDTVRRSAYDDTDIVLNVEDIAAELLKNVGIEGEISDKTGSTVVLENEMEPVVGDDGKLAYEKREVKHYYNCEILEVFRELDDETDTYVRIWKNGLIG